MLKCFGGWRSHNCALQSVPVTAHINDHLRQQYVAGWQPMVHRRRQADDYSSKKFAFCLNRIDKKLMRRKYSKKSLVMRKSFCYNVHYHLNMHLNFLEYGKIY